MKNRNSLGPMIQIHCPYEIIETAGLSLSLILFTLFLSSFSLFFAIIRCQKKIIYYRCLSIPGVFLRTNEHSNSNSIQNQLILITIYRLSFVEQTKCHCPMSEDEFFHNNLSNLKLTKSLVHRQSLDKSDKSETNA